MSLDRTLALEWAPHRIRVNCVAPGVIESSGLAQCMKDQDIDGVAGEVIHPGVGLFLCDTPDAEYETDVCRTYND